MSKYFNKNKVSEQTRDDALKIARGTQRPGQTKEQTKLIAQGIQKGIDLYKKQQKEKARERDRKHKKMAVSEALPEASTGHSFQAETVKQSKLAWVLLILSWLCFAAYLVLNP